MNVSIVMTTYNGIEYIEAQLESIRFQTYAVEEVLIFDDCSTDNTFEFIQGYIQAHNLKYWHLYRNKMNLGFNENFREALFVSKGDIVFLCDQDDIWLDNKVKELVGLFENNEEAMVIASDFVLIDNQGNRIDNQYSRSHYGMMEMQTEKNALSRVDFYNLLKRNFAQGCTMAVKKAIIIRLKEDGYHKLEHDWSLSLLASMDNGCYFFNKPLIEYRIHGNNTIGLHDEKSKQDRMSRIHSIQNEMNRIEFILQYLKATDMRYIKLCKDKRVCELRIQYIKKKQVFHLIGVAIKNLTKSNIRAILGDIAVIVKK